jgi:predicted transcriptional regulator/transcriptional regulator with XRE-family HTH domain
MLKESSVPTQRLAGSRIREKRLDRGLRQAAVAETVGISASYLNLIEHNKRRIGGKLLSDIARALGVDAAQLTEGADSDILDQMRNAAASFHVDAELSRAEEMAGRYPGWGALIATQSRRIDTLQQQLQVVNDRMAFDPKLASSLHEVISAVTAIRSSASILVGPEKLDDDWQRRFHENIHNDSLRLAASSEDLITYLDAPNEEIDQISSPLEKVEKYLVSCGYHLEGLEDGGDINLVVANANLDSAATQLLLGFAKQYARDAKDLPLMAFEAACHETLYDPSALAAFFQIPFAAVLRRLSTLPDGKGHPPMGLAVCDAAGVLTLVKPVPSFTMPRTSGGCPLWPVFSAMTRPDQPVRLQVALPGANEARLLCYAIATTQQSARFDAPPTVQSTMLVIPEPLDVAETALPVGVSCRICPRTHCASRREPPVKGV